MSFNPNSTLRENPLKRVLKTYVVSDVSSKYMTTAIRVLWSDKDFSEMYEKRIILESILREIKQIVMFINCVTSLKEKEHSIQSGFGFWIAYDWPEISCEKFENLICKKFIEAGMEIRSCKTVKGRGKKIFNFLHKLSLLSGRIQKCFLIQVFTVFITY